jgi:hypothetical protein
VKCARQLNRASVAVRIEQRSMRRGVHAATPGMAH